MKRTVFQKLMCLVLSVTILSGVFATTAFAANGSAEGGYRPSLDEMKSYLDASSYEEYLAEYRDENGDLPIPDPQVLQALGGIVSIDVVNDLKKEYSDYAKNAEASYGIVVSESKYSAKSYDDYKEAWKNFAEGGLTYEEMADKTVYLSPESKGTWDVDVPATGMYYIRIKYFNCETTQSGISAIERQLLINEAIPFTEARSLKLNKTWKYNFLKTVDGLKAASGDKQGTTTVYEQLDAGDTYSGVTVESDGYYKFVITVEGTKKSVKVYSIDGDINGNSITPDMVQDSQWSTYYCQDTTGYYNEYFAFYLQEGPNTIGLKGQREPMIIGGIDLVPIGSGADIPSYKDFYAENGLASKKPVSSDAKVTIEAEFPDYMSDNSVTIGGDNSSSATTPSSPSSQIFNTIGKLSYSTVGQWAAYTFKVNETGLYKMSMRFKQNALQGMYVCRALKLKGGIYGDSAAVPFKEAYNTQFDFSDDWQSQYLGDGNQVFEFYFEEGVEYTMYLECSLGSLKELIKRVEDAMKTVNDCYLRILQLTGATPDENYNYKFQETLPMELIALAEQAKVLADTAKAFEDLCGTKGSHIATLETVALLLHNMSADYGWEIAANMANLKSYLGTLGTWINDSKKSTLIVDSITIHSSNASEKALPKAKAGFFGSIWFEIRSFFASFFTDYDSMGLREEPNDDAVSVEVWIATGRDQSNIWRALIDSQQGFTNQTGKAVKLKLVTGGTLLPSILADKGPDVYIGLDSSSIINYAIRNAIVGVGAENYDKWQNNGKMTDEEFNELKTVVSNTYYTIGGKDYRVDQLPKGMTVEQAEALVAQNKAFKSVPYMQITGERYVPAAMDTIRLLGVYYGIPSGMGFAMMFYRSDILAELGRDIPDTWTELMALLPDMQANNMSIGLSYGSAINFILYQSGGNMWRYADRSKDDYSPEYEGALIGLDTNVAKAAFSWVTRLYTEFGFAVSFDASNRFRTGEMPIVISEYTSTYNTLTVYATEINGLWGFCSLPGWEHEENDGTIRIDYSSLCSISATILLHGYSDALSAWQFMQWQTREDIQSEYGNRMVAILGPSAKYESANTLALEGMSWTADELTAIRDQMDNLYSIVNYPGSYIISRYTEFAFLAAVNERADPVEALMGYIDAINDEIYRKRAEFDMPVLKKPSDFKK